MTLEEATTDLTYIIASFCTKYNYYLPLFDSMEDMCAECMLICIRYFKNYDPKRGALSTWVYLHCLSLCKHKWQTARRHNWFEDKIMSLDEPTGPEADTPMIEFVGGTFDVDTDKQNEDKCVIKVLQDNMCQELKDLLEGRSIAEQATELGVTRSEISRRITNNRRWLRRLAKQVRDGTYGRLITRHELALEIMKIVNCAERTAYSKVDRWVKTGRCEKILKPVFKNRIIDERRKCNDRRSCSGKKGVR